MTQQYILFILVGLGVGSIYAAIAMGLVVTYKGTGVINFAQGAMAMWGAYVYDELRKTGNLVFPLFGPVNHVHLGHVPFAAALLLGIVSSAVIGLLAHFIVFRPLRRAPALAKVVASVGLTVIMQALVGLRFDTKARDVDAILPNEPVHLGSLSFSRDRLYLAAIAILIAIGLWAYFRFARLGLATRAAAENELGASLTGFSPDFLAGTTWVLSATVTGFVVILAAPTTSLNPVNYTLYVVPALAVALIGRFNSIGVTCAAGLALGAFQSEITLWTTTKTWWPRWAVVGVTDAVPFLIVIVVLYFLGKSLPTRGALETRSLPDVSRPRNRPVVIVPLVAAGAISVILAPDLWRFGIVTSMIVTIIAISLVVLTGFVGQISLAQAAFAGAAGFVLAKMGNHVPFPLSVLIAASAAAVLGVIIGIPALRIRGAQLAVVTLAGAIAIERFVFRNPQLVGQRGDIIADPRLFGAYFGVRSGTDIIRISFGLLVLAVLTIVAIGTANLVRGDTGRAFLAVRSNERAAAAAGINVSATKLLAFGLSSFLAGVGGAFIGYSRTQLSADSFGVFVGLSFLAFAYLGGITSISGAIVAGTLAPLGIGYTALTHFFGNAGKYYFLLSGVSLVLTAIFNPQGIAGRTRENFDLMMAKRRKKRPAPADGAAVPATVKEPAGVA